MKKRMFALSLALLSCIPLSAKVHGGKALTPGSTSVKNKLIKGVAVAVIFGAFYRTLSKGPQKELSEEEQLRNKSMVTSITTYIDDTILGAPGDVTKGIAATGLLGNIIAHWKAFAAPLILLHQYEECSPRVFDFLKDLFTSEAVAEIVAEAAVKAA